MILEVDDIHTYYETAHILQGVSMGIEKGQTVCLLGRNGAGKTTTLRSIMGLTPPRRGTIRYKDESIAGKAPFQIARMGVGYIPEDKRIFPTLTVRDNLLIAKSSSKRAGSGRTSWTVEDIYDAFPLLEKLDKSRGQDLSGGEQQALSVARALMVNPELLLLDEPTEGLAPLIVESIRELVNNIKSEVTILLAEQNAKFACGISERTYVIDKGKIEFQGSVEELEQREDIQKRLLAI